MHAKCFVLQAKRTPFARAFGWFQEMDAIELASAVLKAMIYEIPIRQEAIDEMIVGASQFHPRVPNIARELILANRLNPSIPGKTLHCGSASGLQAVRDAMHNIRLGVTDVAVAIGVDLVSDFPVVYSKAARSFLGRFSRAESTSEKIKFLKEFNARAWVPNQDMAPDLAFERELIGTYERLADQLGITRKDQDEYAKHSWGRAKLAQNSQINGIVDIYLKDNAVGCLEASAELKDTYDSSEFDKAETLSPLPIGTITKRNTTFMADGASGLLLVSDSFLKRKSLKSDFEIVDTLILGGEREEPSIGTICMGIIEILSRQRLSIEDVDWFEFEELSSCHVLGILRGLRSEEFMKNCGGSDIKAISIAPSKVNPNGGSLAYGYPLSASFGRMLVSAFAGLKQAQGRYAVLAMGAEQGVCGVALVKREVV